MDEDRKLIRALIALGAIAFVLVLACVAMTLSLRVLGVGS